MGAAGAGTDFLQLHRAGVPTGGLAGWLAGALRSAIADGRLAAGSVLPPTRTLAQELAVSRGVVVEAYQRLADEGLVVGRAGAGTVVASRPRTPIVVASRPGTPIEPAGQAPPPAAPQRLVLPQPMPADADGVVDLSPGVPDLSAFPRSAWMRAERAVLTRATTADLGYGDPRGSPRLREQLAGWLGRSRGLRAAPDEILVVAGVAQSLTLLAHVLQRRGVTTLAVEDPGSRGARDSLAHWGLTCTPVAVDQHGLDVDALVEAGPQVALVTPAHQFPTGVVLSPHRRRQLLEWAAGGGLVLEDDYDAEHRYDRAPVPALHASAPQGVAYTGSTSKTLAPGMRLGWLVAPRHLHADLVAARHASDLGSPALPQLVLAQLLGTGEYDRHIRHVRGRQRHRRDAVLAAVREHLPDAQVEGVAAGLHLLLTLPGAPDVDDTALAEQARTAGVLVHPLSWHRQRPGPPGLVLGYAAHPPDRLREAVRRIADVLVAHGVAGR